MAIQLSDSIFVGQQKPVEDKYYNGLSPYTNTAQVNSTLASAIRYRGLTVNIAGVEYWYKDGIADGDLVIKGETAPTVTNIDLTSGNYNISGPGIYLVKVGTIISGGNYKIFFPDPASFNNGDIITIINNNPDGLLALLDIGTVYQYYQGSQKPLSIIPWGMVYIFERIVDGGSSRWVCTPPTAQPTYDINLVVSGSFVAYKIETNGIYTIKTNDPDKACVIRWPNPVNHAGQEVTIINNSDYLGQFESWTEAPSTFDWVPIYNTKVQTNIKTVKGIPVNSTYTFLSNGEFWYLKSSYPIITNVVNSTSYDLNSGNIQLPEAGVFVVAADTAVSNRLKMPDSIYFPGQFITVVNSDTTNDLLLDVSSSNTSVYKLYTTQLDKIRPGGIITVNCIVNKWFVLDGQSY